MTFREKSLWLVGGSLLLSFGAYFWWVLPTAAADVRPDQLVAFGVMVALLVVLQVVGHAVIAIAERRVETDERDRLIGLVGERNGSFVLATGVFLSHVLLAFWVMAELVSIASALWLYRRGA